VPYFSTGGALSRDCNWFEAAAKPESIHIVFVDIPATGFALGGMLIAEKNKKT
jgi:hypothetical protein